VAYSFDGPNSLIILSSTSTLDLRDMWSRYTEWLAISDNSKYLPALTTVGGDDIDADAGTRIPIYLFLQNGWRVRPMESNHTLSVVNGILLVSGGGDPFIDTLGSYRVGIRYSQPVQAISFDTGIGDLDAFKRNTALTGFTFPMNHVATHDPASGLSVTMTRSLDGGALAACTNAVSEVGGGIYKIDFSASDLNAKTITFKASAVGADDTIFTVVTES